MVTIAERIMGLEVRVKMLIWITAAQLGAELIPVVSAYFVHP